MSQQVSCDLIARDGNQTDEIHGRYFRRVTHSPSIYLIVSILSKAYSFTPIFAGVKAIHNVLRHDHHPNIPLSAIHNKHNFLPHHLSYHISCQKERTNTICKQINKIQQYILLRLVSSPLPRHRLFLLDRIIPASPLIGIHNLLSLNFRL